jgi:hypothetical protein
VGGETLVLVDPPDFTGREGVREFANEGVRFAEITDFVPPYAAYLCDFPKGATNGAVRLREGTN